MTEQELEQIRAIVSDVLAPVKAEQGAANAKIDRVIAAHAVTDAKVDRVNDVMAGQVRLRPVPPGTGRRVCAS